MSDLHRAVLHLLTLLARDATSGLVSQELLQAADALRKVLARRTLRLVA